MQSRRENDESEIRTTRMIIITRVSNIVCSNGCWITGITIDRIGEQWMVNVDRVGIKAMAKGRSYGLIRADGAWTEQECRQKRIRINKTSWYGSKTEKEQGAISGCWYG